MLSEVRFDGVHKIFGAETAVEDLNLTVNAGEFLVLHGWERQGTEFVTLYQQLLEA